MRKISVPYVGGLIFLVRNCQTLDCPIWYHCCSMWHSDQSPSDLLVIIWLTKPGRNISSSSSARLARAGKARPDNLMKFCWGLCSELPVATNSTDYTAGPESVGSDMSAWSEQHTQCWVRSGRINNRPWRVLYKARSVIITRDSTSAVIETKP